MKPLVSIGLPVYNGENFLREALKSLLAQDYQNFELIISDNASTDSTAEICREFTARDTRIKYFKAAQNKGASWNFNRVLELSDGEFFMWAGHDDLWQPTFVSKCVEALLNDPEAVLCHSQGQAITSDGKPVGQPYIDFTNEDQTLRERWRRVHKNWQLHAAIYGLIKTSVAKKVLPVTTYASSDLIFVSEIILYGKIIQIPEILQFKRMAALEEARYKSPEGMMEYLGATNISKIRMSRLRIMRKSLNGLRHFNLPPKMYRILILETYQIYIESHFSIDLKETIKSFFV